MELSFIRQQMQAKLEEFKLLNSLYIEGSEKEKRVMLNYLTNEEIKEFDDVINELKDHANQANDIILDIDIITGQFLMIYQEFRKKHQEKMSAETERLTAVHNGISITREPVLYSSFASSAGYDSENNLMDIEFTSGKLYRYMNVPKEFFETIKLRNSMKGVSKELNKFEFVKLN